jgi:hypothetical protein
MAPTEDPCVQGPGTPTDEELVREAKSGSRASQAALLDRCQDALARLVNWWSDRRGLWPEEMEEAWQEAWVGFLRAVNDYTEQRRKGRGPACFRTFMNQVVRDHLEKWGRWRSRAESHYDRSVDLAPELDRRALHAPKDPVGTSPPDTRAADPVEAAVWHEVCARLTAGVGGLDARLRWLWERRAAGRSLHEVAAEGDLSYDQAKRMCRKMVAVLQQAVR